MKINIIPINKSEKKIWVKPTVKRKGHYRRITGAKEVEEKHSQLISGFKDMTYYYDFENYDEINGILLKQKDEDGWLPTFENMIINIAGEPHYFVAEAWYDGCLESRDYGPDTNPMEIKGSFKGIAQEETKLGVLDHAEYLPDSDMAQYGISYVTKKVPRDLYGQFNESQFKIPDETFNDKINKDEKVMENYYYIYEKDREFIKVSGIWNWK
jgi:hypothetical protein